MSKNIFHILAVLPNPLSNPELTITQSSAWCVGWRVGQALCITMMEAKIIFHVLCRAA